MPGQIREVDLMIFDGKMKGFALGHAQGGRRLDWHSSNALSGAGTAAMVSQSSFRRWFLPSERGDVMDPFYGGKTVIPTMITLTPT